MGLDNIHINNDLIEIKIHINKKIIDDCIEIVSKELEHIQKGRIDGKQYAGCLFEDGSKLIWIAPGHDFEIK